jgi:hypothetical protein
MLTKHKIAVALATILLTVALTAPAKAAERNFRPAIGDVRSDLAGPERIVTTPEGGINVYTNTGKLASNYPLYINGVVVSSPVLADIDATGEKEIVFVGRDSSGNYTLYAYRGDKTLLASISLGTATVYYDPVVILNSSGKDDIILTTTQGQVLLFHYNSGAWQQSSVATVGQMAGVAVYSAGQEITINYPNQAKLDVYAKVGASWIKQKTIILTNPIVYPVLYGSQNYYGVDSNGKLVAINKITGLSLGNNFPVAFVSLPIGSPYWVEVDSNHSGYELAVVLNDGTLAILDESGNILSSKFHKSKSFANYHNSAFDASNNAIFIPLNNDGGILAALGKQTIATSLSRKGFSVTSSTIGNAPIAINNVQVTSSFNKIIVSWNSYYDFYGDFSHFNLYRALSATSSYNTSTLLTSIYSASNTAFSDKTVLSGMNYYYAVRAVNSGGKESNNSWIGPVQFIKIDLSQATVLHLKLNDPASSTVFADSSGYANNGTCLKNFCPQLGYAGVSSTAAYFAGNGEHVRIKSSNSLKISDAVTIEAWIKPNYSELYENGQIIANKSNNYELGANKDGVLYAGITNVSNVRKIVKTNSALLTPNTWNHVAMTYDGSYITLYVNGNITASSTFSGKIKTDDALLLVGQFQGHYYYKGLIDELKIYNIALTAEDIYNIAGFTATSSEYSLNLKFDDPASSTVFTDSSGNANNGTCLKNFCPQLGYAGVSSTAVYFAGNGEHVRINSSNSLKPQSTITLEAWVRPDFATTSQNYQVIINKGMIMNWG